MLSEQIRQRLVIAVTDERMGTEVWESINEALSNTGSGGATVIEDGILPAGTYNGDVVLIGSTDVGGAIKINGSLICTGTLFNPSGFAITIRGSLYANNINLTPLSDLVEQGDLFVRGDVHSGSSFRMRRTYVSSLQTLELGTFLSAEVFIPTETTEILA